MRIWPLLVMGLPILAFAAGYPKSRYQPIIDALPFGAMAEATATAAPQQAATQEEIEELSNEINLCAMTITPEGRVAVGLIDNALDPPAYIVLFDSDEKNGLELVLSDYDREIATFKREDILFTLQLGLGLVETVTPQSLAEAKAAEAEAVAQAEEAKRKRPNSLAEQLIAMQLSLPPDVEAPPLPIPMGDPEIFTRTFDPSREGEAPETEEQAIVQAGVEEMKAAIAAGESPQEYLKRLVEHRQKEVERQKEEKRIAQENIERDVAENNLNADEEAYIRRRTNIELMKKGVVPLNPVNDLSDDEIDEINTALDEGE